MRRDAGGGKLLQVLGLAFGLAIIVGNTIGVGILRTPGEIAQRLPSETWIVAVWLAGGVYALLGAISLAELGAMIPRSGGQYVFVRRALGEYPAFFVGWSDWISSAGSIAAVAIVIGEYSGAVVPALAGRSTLVGVAVVVAFTMLLGQGVRVGDFAQELSSALKALAFAALIAACFLLPARFDAPAPEPLAFPRGASFVTALVVALQSVILTYDGWTGVIYFGEEVRRPGRDIPRAMIGGVAIVIAIYLAVNFALLHVLGAARMAGDAFVAGSASRALFGARGDLVIHLVMIVSLASSVNALLFLTSRVPVAMSRDGLFPSACGAVSPRGTPMPSLLASAFVAIAFLVTGTFDAVLAVLAFFFVASYVLSFTSVFVLRMREPNAARPFRAWGFPWTTGVALLGSIAFLVASVVGDWESSWKSLALLVASYPAFLAVRRARAR
jgi:APA family basic amino acid/polyamine antiporter